MTFLSQKKLNCDSLYKIVFIFALFYQKEHILMTIYYLFTTTTISMWNMATTMSTSTTMTLRG